MKRIFSILCVLIALTSVDHAQAFYNCIDKQGNSIITDNPPPDAICNDPGSSNQSSRGGNLVEIQQITILLNKLERKSIQQSLTSSEIEQQTYLLEELSRYDTSDGRRRIIKTLEILESKSIAGGLTKAERNQQSTLIQLQRRLSKNTGKGDADNEANRQEVDIGAQNDEQKSKQIEQKKELKRLLKIPRLGY
ncbi:MAG: DUF4124 domain-containing protein [Syntrophaceae bacterium]|nr:DUF4124 domain-containing protein [Syntrophaceae bacterium]